MTPQEFEQRLKQGKMQLHLRIIARRLTRDHDTAQDLVQETLTRAFTYLHLYREDKNFFAWLATIMRNEYIDNMRRAQRFPSPIDIKFFAAGVPQTSSVQTLVREIIDALKIMSPQQREALLLVFWHGLTYSEVAERLGVPINTVRTRIHRARHKALDRIENGRAREAPRR
jgi:RNA polymerase sigma-70 factor, ECF subfamily